jgi:hypothetical protein
VNAYGVEYGAPADATTPSLTSWMAIAYGDAAFLRTDQAFLFTGATLLGVLALASVAVLVGGRVRPAPVQTRGRPHRYSASAAAHARHDRP